MQLLPECRQNRKGGAHLFNPTLKGNIMSEEKVIPRYDEYLAMKKELEHLIEKTD
jgi:hypothetical protein